MKQNSAVGAAYDRAGFACPRKGSAVIDRAYSGKWTVLIFILLLLGSAVPAHAAGEYRTVEVESLKITMDSEWGIQAATGYLPIRFDITNLGDARKIEIFGRSNRWISYGGYGGSGQGNLDVRQVLLLKRGDRVRLTVPMPIFAENENIQMQIHEGGRTLTSFNYVAIQSGRPLEDSPALIVADPSSAFGVAATSWLRSVAYGYGSRYYPAGTVGVPSRGSGGTATKLGPKLDFILEPSRLPTNWLGYTSLRAVLLGPKEWEQLSEVQRSALLAWAASGGDLMFVDGAIETPFPEKQSRPLGMGDGHEGTEPYFLGRIYFPKSADIDQKGLTSTLAVAQDIVQVSAWALPLNRLPSWSSIEERGFRLPIPGVEGLPARSYATILVLFSLLIGPINYAFLWRKRQQVLLVLTVPLLSALFIVLLFAYAAIGEGFGVRGRAATFTVLDQTTNQAATRARASLYAAGMAPSGGLHFSREIAVIPIGPDGKGIRGESIDLTESQQLSGGVIKARAPTNIEEAGFRPARERLTFSRESDHITVVNGLGAPVNRLFYRDGDRVYTLDGPLGAGEKGVLKAGFWKSEEVFNTVFPDLHLPDAVAPEKYRRIITEQASGTYLAVMDHSPFWEPGVPKLDERGSFHLVLGYPGAER